MIDKRKYPAIAQQYWKHIFFMHWRVNPDVLKPYIPAPLQLDTFAGSAWLSVVCFVAKHSRLLYTPFYLVPPAIQTNVRTYVKVPNQKEHGVYFLNLFLNNQFATVGARLMFNLPFQQIHATLDHQDQTFIYKNLQQSETKLNVRLHSSGERDESSLGTFLTERYAIYNRKQNRIIKIPIIHSKWETNRAKAMIFESNIHPLIDGKQPQHVQIGENKLARLYPYETIGYYL